MSDESVHMLTGVVLGVLLAGLAVHSCTRFDWGGKYCRQRFAQATTGTDTLAVVNAESYCFDVLKRKS